MAYLGPRHFWALVVPSVALSCTALTDLPEPGEAPVAEACEVPRLQCGEACVDVSSSAEHCGACDVVCALDNATSTCALGQCEVSACADGFLDCDADVDNGCEQSSTTDSHCGACDAVCDTAPPNGTAECAMGVCSLVTCTAGFSDCDGNATNGCEAELATNGEHCGACGHSCLGGACSDSTCQAVEIATGQPNVQALGANATHIYWTRYQIPMAGNGLGSVVRAEEPTVGTFSTTALLTDLCEPASMIVATSALYVADPCLTIATTDEEIYRIELDGSDSIGLSNGIGAARPIVLDDGFVYFFGRVSTTPWVHRVALAGGAPEALIAVDSFSRSVLVVHEGFVYFYDEGLSISRLERWEIGTDTSLKQVLLTKPSSTPQNIIVAGGRLYMLGFGQLATLELDQSNQTEVSIDVDARGRALAADATHVYYSGLDASVPELRRVALTGGAPEKVADLSQTVDALFVDDRAVYWEDNATIWRLAK